MELPDLFNQPVVETKSYHDTNNEPDVTESENKASKQEDIILEMFKKKPDAEFSAEDILELWNKAGHNAVPLTSIRRAISNLAYEGSETVVKNPEIIKTSHQKVGMYGKKIFTWTLRKF